MYPHVVQFETRTQQFELEAQLTRERKRARAGTTIDRASPLARIRSALTDLNLRGPTAPSPR